jgi:MFS family permease
MRFSKIILLATIVAATVMGLAATDLILPAIPTLAQSLDGTPTQAQWVLASFAAGSALGLLAFGEICSRSHPKIAVAASLVIFGLSSFLATQLQSLNELIAIRFIQGFSTAAPVVVAPGLIRTILPEHQALRALGIMGSIESLTPALAPIVGPWLLP